MLSPLDDYPVHQTSEVMRHVATSDRNFYDRYYFNLYAPEHDLFVVVGYGQYPNLGTADAFVVASRGTDHRVVRASRELGADRMDASVGPIRIEVIEGLKRLRVVCEGPTGDETDDAGITLDATFEGVIPATLEPRHHQREFERVTFDTQRLAQTGRWSGAVTIGDESFAIEPQGWWGYRDRSWGVRPVGEAEPPGIKASQMGGTFFWIYTPIQFDDHTLLVIAQEVEDGSRVLEMAMRVWNDGRVEHLGRPEHEVKFVPGTRAASHVTWHLTEPDGSPLTVEIEPTFPCYLLKGTGYGMDEDWRHGMWQGALKVDRLKWDLADPAVRAGIFGLFENKARVTATGPGGERRGWGMLEFACLGAHQRSGFAGWEDIGLFPAE